MTSMASEMARNRPSSGSFRSSPNRVAAKPKNTPNTTTGRMASSAAERMMLDGTSDFSQSPRAGAAVRAVSETPTLARRVAALCGSTGHRARKPCVARTP